MPQDQMPPQDAPDRRPGPRPLPLHLATANLMLLSSLAVWPSARSVSPLWNPLLQPRLAALAPALAAVDPNEFADALIRLAATRMAAMTGGLLRYRRHGWQRDLADPPAIWQEGGSRMLTYADDGIPVLLVPSLVNRAYILDLAEGQSLARFLSGRGLRPFLLDWGSPEGSPEQDFDLAAYIARLVRALAFLRRETGRAPLLLGYCMGGNLTLAAALQAPEDVAGLALLATPWDFHAGGAHQAALVQALAPALAPAATDGTTPPLFGVDLLQGFFWALDPLTAMKKFTQFGLLAEDSEAARRFVAMEDWLNDGVPLAGRVARECLIGWYGENAPPAGRWQVGGNPVRPRDWRKPALVVLPERDRLVPREGAAALLAQLPQADRLDVPSGHIGMMVGPRAETGLWRPLSDWLLRTGGNAAGPVRPSVRTRRKAPPVTKVRA